MSGNSQPKNPLRLATSGFEFILTFMFFLAGGIALDRWINTTPAFTVWGAILGFGGALYRLLKQVKSASGLDTPDRKDDQTGEQDRQDDRSQ